MVMDPGGNEESIMERGIEEGESEPEDGEILDEVEEEEEENRSSSRNHHRGGQYTRKHNRQRRSHNHNHHHQHHNNNFFRQYPSPVKYNNRSERSGGISRTLEYARYLKKFSSINKSISDKRARLLERQESDNRDRSHHRSRSGSPKHHNRGGSHQHLLNNEGKSQVPHNSSDVHSTSNRLNLTIKKEKGGSRIVNCPEKVAVEETEEVSADEMADDVPSPAPSIEVVEKVSTTKAPEIITLDSTDTSDDDEKENVIGAETVQHETTVPEEVPDTTVPTTGPNISAPVMVSETALTEATTDANTECPVIESSSNNILDDDSDITDIDEAILETNKRPKTIDPNVSNSAVNLDVDAETAPLEMNDIELEGMNSSDKAYDYTVEEIYLDENEHALEGIDEIEQSHLSDEEIDVLELRNKLLADLVNKTDSMASPSPGGQSDNILEESCDQNTVEGKENKGIDGLENAQDTTSANNNEEEEEALRAVLLSLITNKKAKTAESGKEDNTASSTTKSSQDHDPKSLVKSQDESSKVKPKPLLSIRLSEEERRSSINSRRCSNSSNSHHSSSNSSRNRPRSPPSRKRSPTYRRSSVESRRTSKDYDYDRRYRRRSRSRSSERTRKTSPRGRDDTYRKKTSRATTLSPPPSNRNKEPDSNTNTATATTLNASRSSSKDSQSSISSIKDLPDNDLRKTLLKNAGLQKKTSLGMLSQSIPSAPLKLDLNVLDQHGKLPGDDVEELMIRRTVNFTDIGIDNAVTVASTSNNWVQFDNNGTPVLDTSLGMERHQTIPANFDVTAGRSLQDMQFLASEEAMIQRTVFSGPPIFQQFQPYVTALAKSPLLLQQLQVFRAENGLPPIMPPQDVNVNTLNSTPDLPIGLQNLCDNNSATASPGRAQNKRKRGIRTRGKRKPRANAVANKQLNVPIQKSSPPNGSESGGVPKNSSLIKVVTTTPVQSSPSGAVKGAASLGTSIKIAANAPGIPTTVSKSPIQQVSVVTKPLQKSSPFASPALSPTTSIAQTALPKVGINNVQHYLQQGPFKDTVNQPKQPFTRIIIPLRENDSTSEEEDETTKSNNKGSKALGTNFQKSLDEFLKRARDEAERKAITRVNNSVGPKNKLVDTTVTAGQVKKASISSLPSIPSKKSNVSILPKPKQPTKTSGKATASISNVSAQKLSSVSVQREETSCTATQGLNSAEISNVSPSPAKKPKLSQPVPVLPITENIDKVDTDKELPVSSVSPEPKNVEPPKSNETPVIPAASSTTAKKPIANNEQKAQPRLRKKLLRKDNGSPKKPAPAVAAASKGVVNNNIVLNKPVSTLGANKKALPSTEKITSSNNIGSTTNGVTRIPPGPSSPQSSKQIIDDLTKKIIESRDQLALSSKERELLHCRQSCFDGLKDIHKVLIQHTRLNMLDSKLQSEIKAAEKHLEELRKKQLDVRLKASAVNKSIKDKSKIVLPAKADCITLEREVKKLGDKIMGDRFYKVTDLFTKDIEEVVKEITVLHSRQPTNLKLERGVIFHQVISDIDPTSTFTKANLTSSASATSMTNGLPAPSKSTSVADVAAAVALTAKSQQSKPSQKTNLSKNNLTTVGNEAQKTLSKKTNINSRIAATEMAFLTRHGRISPTQMDRKNVMESQTESDESHYGFADGDVMTVVEVKYTRSVLGKINDQEISTQNLFGASAIRLDPLVELCPENLEKNVCMREGCNLQHI